MDLRQLEAFVAVAEELHFGRAAKRMHMAQPPISRHICHLEEEVGAQLLVRSRRGVELTPAGQAFLDEARATLSQARRAARVPQRVARGEVGRLRIGHVDSASSELLPTALRAFHDRYPDVRLAVEEYRTAALVQALRSDHLDVAFVRPPVTDDGLHCEVVVHEPLVVAMPAEHPLADDERVPIERLADERFIVAPWHEHPALHDEVIATCRRAGFDPSIAEEAYPISSVVLLVAAGLGVSLVPAFLAKHLCQGNVVYRHLQEPAGGLQLSLAWPADGASPAVEAFVEI
ncbi:MAG TPA: LysR substrate-binding domain-containing protein, partial [Acidimicrobiales bacterium]|nr:LysR substrate-binding domain-containing protein [Acidimicrobiales bacterium]